MDHQKLYINYRLDVFKMCLYMVKNYQDAEDLTQDIFAKVLQTDFQHILEPKYWVIRVTMNECKSFLRKKKMLPFDHSSKIFKSIPSSDADIGKQVIDAETDDELLKALAELPEQIRIVFVLRYFQQLSLYEIASILKIPLGTVKSRLHKGTKKFKKRYAEKKEEIRSEGMK
ncbi:RNA polymerase sigma factor [Alkalihalobacillus sp. 1P02AB]|uniref:RNA polymerase sigma factor n=1 Tax=Alkalihalobacillus sp. 1P02AB TaxID=3132260 RepID=UPI0039A47FA4